MGRIIITNHHQPSPPSAPSGPFPPPHSSVPCSRASARTTTLNKSEREKPARHYRTLFAKILATFAIRKKAKMRLITTNHPRPRRIPDIWCHGFSRYLGRQLTPAEKIVISALEKSRTARPTPILIIDSGNHDSRPILRAYLSYRLATSPQGATALLCTPDNPKKTRRIPRLRHITYRRIETVRGSTPSFMLLLDAHLARTYSPLIRDTRNFRRVCSTLYPILDPSGFLVIHLRLDPWSPYGCDTGHITHLTVTKNPPPEPPPSVTVITIPVIDRIVPLLHTLIDDKKREGAHPPSL